MRCEITKINQFGERGGETPNMKVWDQHDELSREMIEKQEIMEKIIMKNSESIKNIDEDIKRLSMEKTGG